MEFSVNYHSNQANELLKLGKSDILGRSFGFSQGTMYSLWIDWFINSSIYSYYCYHYI